MAPNIRLASPTVFAALTGCVLAPIPSGYTGVLLGTSGVDRKPLHEGEHFVSLLDSVETYDLQAQEKTEDLTAVSADGMALDARASVLTFHPVPDQVVALAREVGPDYYQVLIRPVVRSVARSVLAGYRVDTLDTPGIDRAEKEVTEATTRILRPYHVVFDSITLRTLNITQSSECYRAIVATSVEQQKVLAAQQLLELAKRRAQERRLEARGIAESNALLAPTITSELLTDAATRAWSKLLTSPSTHVEVRAPAQPYVLEVRP